MELSRKKDPDSKGCSETPQPLKMLKKTTIVFEKDTTMTKSALGSEILEPNFATSRLAPKVVSAFYCLHFRPISDKSPYGLMVACFRQEHEFVSNENVDSLEVLSPSRKCEGEILEIPKMIGGVEFDRNASLW